MHDLSFTLAAVAPPNFEVVFFAEWNKDNHVRKVLDQVYCFSVNRKSHVHLLQLAHVDQNDWTFGETKCQKLLGGLLVGHRGK